MPFQDKMLVKARKRRKLMMEQITIYTDGACSGNPGPGGWGSNFII